MSNETKNLTVIIFSYNRHKFLIRTLKYYSRFKIKILVVDGSESLLEDNILLNNKIEYYHLTKNYYSRFAYAANKIKTKYVIIGNDDEFLMINTLEVCIDFLENNSDYSSCIGSTIVINSKYKKNFYQLGYIFHKDMQFKEEGEIDRLRKLILKPSHHAYNSVIRKKTFIKIGNFLNNYQVEENIFFNELVINLLIVQDGKTNWINQLTWIRSFENDPITTKGWERNLNQQQNYFHWFKNLNDNKKRDIILKLSDNLFKEGIREEYFEIIFDSVKKISVEMTNLHKIEIKKTFLSKIFSILAKSKFKNNKIINLFLSMIINFNIFGKIYGMRLKKVMSLMDSSNTKYDEKELRHIEEIITKFHS